MEHNTNTINDKSLLLSAFLQSWLGMSFLGTFIIEAYLGASLVTIGALALLMALFFMNGLSRTDLLLTEQGPSWWRHHKALHLLHHVHGEGELAGIWVGIILLAYLFLSGHSESVHLPYAAALALAGIMAVANMATKNIIPILNLLEKRIGVWGAVWIGSLLSSLTGAAASVFASRYLIDRIEEKNRTEVATRLAAGIGMGNGMLPFVAPPILIVWPMLQSKLGWGLGDLLLTVGIPAIIYSGFITYKIRNLVGKTEVSNRKVTLMSPWLMMLLVVVIGNIVSYETTSMMAVNAFVAVIGVFKGADFTEKWQPIILGILLMALEVIGHVAEPFVTWLIVNSVPDTMPILALGIIFFAATAIVSHFADNALASRIFSAVILGMPVAADYGTFLIASVLIGALFGGFLLIPANLPNFPIARIFSIDSGAWLKSALKIYWTAIVPLTWIAFMYYVF